MLGTKDRVDEILELEELWAAPAAPEPAATFRAPRTRALPLVPAWCLGWGWAAFVIGVMLFEPAPDPHAVTPLWGNLVVAGWALALLAAAFAGPALPRVGFAVATVAGALGMVISVACRTTGHHPSSWWLVELGATAALATLAAVGLAGRLRRE
jgi:hypothetical protein